MLARLNVVEFVEEWNPRELQQIPAARDGRQYGIREPFNTS